MPGEKKTNSKTWKILQTHSAEATFSESIFNHSVEEKINLLFRSYFKINFFCGRAALCGRGCRFSTQGRFRGWARESHGWLGLLLGIMGNIDKEGQSPCSPLSPVTSHVSMRSSGDPMFCSVEAPLWLWHQQSTEKNDLKYAIWGSITGHRRRVW